MTDDNVVEYHGNVEALKQALSVPLGEGVTFREIERGGRKFIKVTVEGGSFTTMHRHDKGHIISLPKSDGLYITMGPDGGFDVTELDKLDGKYVEFFTGTAYHGVYNRGPGSINYYTTGPDGSYFNKKIHRKALEFLGDNDLL